MTENKIMATVQGKPITEQDVNLFLQALVNEIGQQKAMNYQLPEGKKKLLGELISQEVIYLDAIERGLDREEPFKQELEAVRKNLLRHYAMKKLLGAVNIEEEEVSGYYEAHKEQFKDPESVRASHILVESKQEADELLSQIQAGSAFEEAAKQYSKCPTGANGGDLGYFTRGKMVPEFEEAVFNLKKGEISQPIETQFGYHIIQLTDRKEAQNKPYDEVRQQLAQQLVDKKRHAVYLEKSKELGKKYEVKINE